MITYLITIALFLLAALLALHLGDRMLCREAQQLQPDWEQQAITTKENVLYAGIGVLSGAAVGFTVGLNMHLLPLWVAFLCMGMAMRVDRRLRIIPDEIPLAMLAGSAVHFLLIALFARPMLMGFFLSCLLGGAVGFVLLFAVSVLSHGGVGMGDVKLIGALGALCGGICVEGTLFLATLLAAGYGVYLLLVKKVGLKYSMPFGPFLFFGFVGTMILGIC